MIIVGAGPAGAAAALGLQGSKVLMLDVGHQPDPLAKSYDENYYKYKSASNKGDELLLGRNYESLHNISQPYLMPKLKAPFQRYVTQARSELGKVISPDFNTQLSYAKGGLANAWGAQLLRYDDDDLKEFPIEYADLEPHYEELEQEIGLSGANDDLGVIYGSSKNLQAPLEKGKLAKKILSRYKRKKKSFHKKGFRIGEPRLGVISESHKGRRPADYNNLEFFKPNVEANYTPIFTIDRLIAEGELEYLCGRYVENISDDDICVVHARNLCLGIDEQYLAKKVIICAGAVNSAKLVLKSRCDYETRLPIMDNSLSLIPFVEVSSIGSALEKKSYYNQLCLAYECEDDKQRVIGTFYALTGVLATDLMFDLPVAASVMPLIAKNIFPAMLVLHLWYETLPSSQNWLSLMADNQLQINYKQITNKPIEKKAISILRGLGLISHSKLIQYPEAGSSFHYAGTLPMKKEPTSPYQTWVDGRLNGSNNIFVADGSIFPVLPAKNLSLTIMANALRVARGIGAKV